MLTPAFAAPSFASTPVMTTTIEAVADTVASGGFLAYQVEYEVSNLSEDGATGATFRIPRPVGTDPNGAPVTASGTPTVQGNVDVVSIDTSNPDFVIIKLRDLVPGTTGEFQVGWTIPNGTTLPGTEFPAEADLVYQDGSGETPGDQTAQAQTPDPIVSTAAAALQATKQTITPANEALVVADQEVTYRLFACNPTLPGTGALNYKDLTLVDTLPAGTQFVSATGGGVYDAAANTVTWPAQPAPAQNRCGSPSESVQLTVVYPAGTFVPAPATPQATNTVRNLLNATATGIDGTALSVDGFQEHSFIGPPLGGTSGTVTYGANKGARDAGFPSTDTSKRFRWTNDYWWYPEGSPQIDDSKVRNYAITDRLSCLINGVAESPAITTTDPMATAFPGMIAVPSDQCKDLAFDLKSISPANRGLANLVEYQLVTWDGTAAHTYVVTKAELGASGWVYIHAGDPGFNAGSGDFTLNLPANEMVTDLRVVGTGQQGRESWVGYDFRGTVTPAFASSGLLTMTNTKNTVVGPVVNAGTTPAPGIVATHPWTAQANFSHSVPDPQVSKKALRSTSNLKPGDTVAWQLAISNGAAGIDTPIRPQLFDVLPVGFELDEDSITWSNLDEVGEPDLTVSERSIAGQTRTVLEWTWPAGTELKYGDPSPTVQFNTLVTLQTHAGSYSGDQGQIAVLFDENGAITNPAGSNKPTDKWDLNENGDTTEGVARADAAWAILPAAGATIQKWVKGALDADWTKDGLTNATWDGADSQVDYRLAVSNPNTLTLTDLTIYDVLPYVGDEAIGKDLAGDARGTQWPVLFDSVTSLPAGATAEYSTSDNPCRPELFGGTAGQALPAGCDDDWSTTVPADPSTVRALKFNLPQVDPSADPTFIEFRTQAPKLTGADDLAFTDPTAVANNNTAWQTFRVTATGGRESLLAAEAPVVSVRRAAGMIGNWVWEDLNQNGVQDKGEPGIEGITVNLLDKDGNPVLDENGDPITTVTDKDGYYSFVVPLGEWRVSFTDVPAKYQPTTPAAGGDDKTDSDLTQIGAPTHPVTITDPVRNGEGSNLNMNLDAGLVLANVSIVKDDGKSLVKPGEETTYTIKVKNNATIAEAQDLTVSDVLPAELEYVSSSGQGTYDADSNTVTWTVDSIQPGGEVELTVTAKVSDTVAPDTEITNVATVKGANCTTPGGCETTDVDVTPPQVQIVKDDHKTVVGLGEELTYDVTVSNLSTLSDANEVVVTDTLPEQLTFVSASDGGVYDQDTHTVTWGLGTLAKGTDRTVQVTATVNDDTPAGDTITNGATVTTAEGCTDPDDCETVDVDHTPDISIVKDDHKTVVAPGMDLTYDVIVTNDAEWAATGVIATDLLPENVTFVSASDGGTYNSANGTVTWNLGELAKNTSETVQVTVTVNESAQDGDLVVNNATVTTEQGCFDEQDCESSDTDTVNKVAAELAETGTAFANIAIWTGGGLALLGAALILIRRRRHNTAG